MGRAEHDGDAGRGERRRARRMAIGTAALAAMIVGCASPHDKYFKSTDSRANVYVAPYRQTDIDKVAILPFKAPTELIGSSVSDLFVTEILRSGKYTLVERGQMSKVLSESELALAGLSAAKAVEVGAMMGADGVIIGTVPEYGTLAHRGRPYPVVGITARLIDTKNGKVVWSADLAAKAEKRGVTLSEQARIVVHEMCAALYQQWDRQKRPRRR